MTEVSVPPQNSQTPY